MSYLQTRARINNLLNVYLAPTILTTRLQDTPKQFITPRPRPWQPLNWKGIHRDQIIGVSPELFLMVVAGAAEIEDPIREYSRESWGYIHPIHPAMARFMGGRFTPDGAVLELGVWEKEERQHGPTFNKIYQQLTGKKLQPNPNSVAGYQPTVNPWEDAHSHVLSRITTEWGAAGVYLWLAAHSTGNLQAAIVEPLQDEINHLSKFWGFSRWAFGDNFHEQLRGTTHNLFVLLNHHQGERTHGSALLYETSKLEQVRTITELSFALSRILVRLYCWDRQLQPRDLYELFVSPLSIEAMEQFLTKRVA